MIDAALAKGSFVRNSVVGQRSTDVRKRHQSGQFIARSFPVPEPRESHRRRPPEGGAEDGALFGAIRGSDPNYPIVFIEL